MTARSRRAFVLGLAAAAAAAAGTARAESSADRLKDAGQKLADIEKREGGRLGVAVLDARGGALLLHREGEAFPMCSTFKLMAAAAILKRVDAGQERLDRKVAYGQADLLDYAPVTKAHAAEGAMTLGDLCAAAIDWSDNTAANLILAAIGGPAGFTAFARSLGDDATRLDRNEPALNAAIPGDPRDTTTPLAMALDAQKVLIGDVLSEASRRQLDLWLANDKVGDKRLRAGLPPSWGIGDKTGSGDHGTANVIGILKPPGGAPLIAAVYYTEGPEAMDARNAVHREIGALIAETFRSLNAMEDAMPVAGLITTRSAFTPEETMRRLRSAVEGKGMTVFAHIDHAAGAAAAGLTLRPTDLLIFGAARGGTPLMQAAQTLGIDLPLKALVWRDADGTTWLSYNDPAWLAGRHGIDPKGAAPLAKALEAVAAEATAP